MQDFRVEERHYFRESKSEAARHKSMILQERLYFRNIPLSSWVEHEMLVEEDMPDLQHIAKGRSVFSTKSPSEDGRAAVSRLLEHAAASGSTAQLVAALNNGHAG
jgi:hypothetical protein